MLPSRVRHQIREAAHQWGSGSRATAEKQREPVFAQVTEVHTIKACVGIQAVKHGEKCGGLQKEDRRVKLGPACRNRKADLPSARGQPPEREG